MCPVIRISDETFALLQQLAQPLVDTPDSAIRRVLERYLASLPTAPKPARADHGAAEDASSSTASTVYPAESAPNLTHTSFLSGSVDGVQVTKWGFLTLQAHERALKKMHGDVARLIKDSRAHVRLGKHTDKGFLPSADGKYSVQAVEANKAWKVALELAKQFQFPIEVEFKWQDKEGAAFPGESGHMSWSPQPPVILE